MVEFEGCGAGRLRVGELDLTRGEDAVVFPAAECTRTQAGIDLDPDQNDCTGLSRADADDGSPRRGATRVSLAGHAEGSRGQALVVWLGADGDRDVCGGPGVPLEAVGLWSDASADGDPILSVTGTGAALSLGLTTAGSSPAVLSWSSRGYFVAHASAEGEMQVQFLEQLMPGVGECAMDNPTLEITGAATMVGGGAADHPALVMGKIRSVCGRADRELGLAWQEGCGGGGGKVMFAHLGYAQQSGELCIASGPTVLAEGDASAGLMRPTVAFVEQDFVTSSFSRPDGDGGDEEASGGFVVAWLQAGDNGVQVMAQRIAARDGLPVRAVQAVTDGESPAAPSDVHLHSLDGVLRATFHDPARAAFVSVEMFTGGADTGGDEEPAAAGE